MTRRKLPLSFVFLLLTTCRDSSAPPIVTKPPPNPQSVSVLTQHNDNSRSGWNDNETALTTTNVNTQKFGQVFTLAVDDQVYAQPLVVGHVNIGGSDHNVVFIATVNNTLYAYDGDDGTLYWQKSFTAPGMRPPTHSDMTGACNGSYTDFSGNIGIVGTPVIDAGTGTMYFVARSTTGNTFVQFLHAVKIVDGSEIPGSPMQITASSTGNGDGSVNGVIAFDAQRANQRQGLTLLNGVVYVSFSSHCDWGPYHGWILGYDASTVQQRIVYNDTPNGYAGGMWESGTGMAADADGNLYVVTGNGTVGDAGDPTNPINRGSSALKLTPTGSTLRVASYFTPFNYQFLNDNDLDYGGMGALLIPNSGLYLTGGKDGKLYLLNRDAMGGYLPSSNQVQQVVLLSGNANMHCQAAYYKGSSKEFVYVWAENDPLRGIPFDRASNLLSAQSQVFSSVAGPTGQSGAILSVSSNGSQDGSGILWAAYASTGDAEHTVSPGILRAFDANDISKELWNNQQKPRDAGGSYAKFAAPTIANGHVYLPTSQTVSSSTDCSNGRNMTNLAQVPGGEDDPSVQAAAAKAIELITDGARVGLGSGRAVWAFIAKLGALRLAGLRVTAVTASQASTREAQRAGIPLIELGEGGPLDLTIDGADEVAPNLDLVKGRGGAMVRERIVAAASASQVIIVGEDKLVQALGERGGIPVEVIPFAEWPAMRGLEALGLDPTRRLEPSGSRPVITENGNLIFDCALPAPMSGGSAARELEQALLAIVGVVDTGLFLGTADRVVVGKHDGHADEMTRSSLRKSALDSVVD